jgi:heme/copper-type cytochrome/quinol oxidase subunit 2
MLFYWFLIAALLISIAAVLALWSMREYESAAPNPEKAAVPRLEREVRAEEKDGRTIRGTIVLPKDHKVVK